MPWLAAVPPQGGAARKPARANAEVDITIVFETVGFASSTRVKVRDMIAHKDLGVAVGSWTAARVPPHGVAALRL